MEGASITKTFKFTFSFGKLCVYGALSTARLKPSLTVEMQVENNASNEYYQLRYQPTSFFHSSVSHWLNSALSSLYEVGSQHNFLQRSGTSLLITEFISLFVV